MNRIYNALCAEELKHWLADKPEPEECKIEDTAARLLALGRIDPLTPPSDETVRRWCREGRFPHAHKIRAKGRGGAWRIPEADLVAFAKPRPGPKGPRRKG